MLIAILLSVESPPHWGILLADTTTWTPYLYDGKRQQSMIDEAWFVWKELLKLLRDVVPIGASCGKIRIGDCPLQEDDITCGFLSLSQIIPNDSVCVMLSCIRAIRKIWMVV